MGYCQPSFNPRTTISRDFGLIACLPASIALPPSRIRASSTLSSLSFACAVASSVRSAAISESFDRVQPSTEMLSAPASNTEYDKIRICLLYLDKRLNRLAALDAIRPSLSVTKLRVRTDAELMENR